MCEAHWFGALNEAPRFCSSSHFVISADWLHFLLLSSILPDWVRKIET